MGAAQHGAPLALLQPRATAISPVALRYGAKGLSAASARRGPPGELRWGSHSRAWRAPQRWPHALVTHDGLGEADAGILIRLELEGFDQVVAFLVEIFREHFHDVPALPTSLRPGLPRLVEFAPRFGGFGFGDGRAWRARFGDAFLSFAQSHFRVEDSVFELGIGRLRPERGRFTFRPGCRIAQRGALALEFFDLATEARNLLL